MLKASQSHLVVEPQFAEVLRIAIVKTDYYPELVNNLEKHCVATLMTNGVPKEQIKTFTVPGSWEIPLMVQKLAKSKQFDAIVTFGVLVKGETHHFDMIASEVGRALMQLSLDYWNSIPIALEVLAVYEKKQAEVRAGDNEHNKGIEAATAVLKMLDAVGEV